MKILAYIKNKRKTIVTSLLIISIIVNILMIISVNNIFNNQDEIKDCAKYAYDKTIENKQSSISGKEEYNDYLYKQCLKIRYGISN